MTEQSAVLQEKWDLGAASDLLIRTLMRMMSGAEVTDLSWGRKGSSGERVAMPSQVVC